MRGRTEVRPFSHLAPQVNFLDFFFTKLHAPMEAVNGANIYGFEVNGAVYYSLTKYVKYLLKAGVASFLENVSLGESQYKLLNRVEFRF